MKKPLIECCDKFIKNQIEEQVYVDAFYTLIVKHMGTYYLLRQVHLGLGSVKWRVHKLMAEIKV